MTEEIIIDVSNCSHKSDDDCMEVPICNEYGDLMGYQSCEAQTLCPYRSQKKIERLEQENKELKRANQSLSILGTDLASAHETVRREFFRADKNKDMWREKAEEYRSALEEIRKVINLAYKTGDYLLGQDYTDLVDRIEKELEVLND